MAKPNGHPLLPGAPTKEPTIVEAKPTALTGDALVEWRVLQERLRAANERLGAADYSVAVAESARTQARVEVQREAVELETFTRRAAERMGIDLRQPGWRFDPSTATFVQVAP